MSKLKMKQTFTVLMLLSLLALAGCNTGTDKAKELELKEKELELKEKELKLKEKGSDEDDSDDSDEAAETVKTKKTEKAEKAESVKGVYTPKAGSAERKQIMNSLRGPVQRELKQDVKFKVNSLKVFGEWAFMQGEPLNKASGKRADLTGTKYDEENWKDYDNNIFTLYKKKGGKWTIVEYAMMCSDPCYLGWDKKHGAPKDIFP